jgi:hypothetical protein
MEAMKNPEVKFSPLIETHSSFWSKAEHMLRLPFFFADQRKTTCPWLIIEVCLSYTSSTHNFSLKALCFHMYRNE